MKKLLIAAACLAATLTLSKTASAEYCYGPPGFGPAVSYAVPVYGPHRVHRPRHPHRRRGPYRALYGPAVRPGYRAFGYGYGYPYGYYTSGTALGVGRGGVSVSFGF